VDNQVLVAQDGRISWPIRLGHPPLLADRFSARPETAPAIEAALGRSAAVALIDAQVTAGQSQNLSGSYGKTQSALFYAESRWQSHTADLLVWIAATSRESILSAYADAAATITASSPVGDAEAVAAGFVTWLSQTSRPWLVILDDLAAPEILAGLWPAGQAGRVLITATETARLPRDSALVLPIGPFSRREAMSYLVSRLSSDPDQRRGAMDLVDALDCEPLALAQASATIASSPLCCHDYCDNFSRRRRQVAGAPGHQPRAGAVTWTLAFDQASQMLPAGSAQAALVLTALLAGQGMPASVFATAAASHFIAGQRAVNASMSQAALQVLERVGLLTIDPQTVPPMIWMSPGAQAFIRAAMPAAMVEQSAATAADALLAAWPKEEPESWLAQSLRSCAATLRHAAGTVLWADGCHPVLLRVGDSLDAARLTGPAVSYWTELSAVSNQVLGPDHPDSLALAERVDAAYLTAGRPAEAISWCQQTVADRARVLGAEHPLTLAARVRLGRALAAGGQAADAITLLTRVVKDSERAVGASNAATVAARAGLAAAYGAAGRLNDAIPVYKRVLADRERELGPHHIDTLNVRGNLASALYAAGKLKEAIPLLEKTLAARESLQGSDHPDTLTARGSLAAAYDAAGRLIVALGLYESTVAGYERVLGPYHRNTLTARANLASAYYAAHRGSEAISMLERTLDDCQRALPAGHPLTLAVRESLDAVSSS
jgi:tetratricopeptide (TPR) repeat protein